MEKTEQQMRVEKFSEKLTQMQVEDKVEVYAVNQVLENGEIVPVVKIRAK